MSSQINQEGFQLFFSKIRFNQHFLRHMGWMPAFAGTTKEMVDTAPVIPAKAGIQKDYWESNNEQSNLSLIL